MPAVAGIINRSHTLSNIASYVLVPAVAGI